MSLKCKGKFQIISKSYEHVMNNRLKKHDFLTFDCLEAIQARPYQCVSHRPRSQARHISSVRYLRSSGRTWSSRYTCILRRRCLAACRILGHSFSTYYVLSAPIYGCPRPHSRMPSSQAECSGQIPSVSLSVLLLCCTQLVFLLLFMPFVPQRTPILYTI